MLTQIIEAFSLESHEEAIAAALVEAAPVVSRLHDAKVSLKELSEDAERGFRAVLEISHEPMTLQVDEVATEEEVLEFSIFLKMEREIIEKMVREYFAEPGRVNLLDIPQIILDHMKPEHLLNKIVVSEFNEQVDPESEMVRDFNAAEGVMPEPEAPEQEEPQAEPE